MTPDQYQLVDFGNGRKLESLAGYLIDRPSPAALGAPRISAAIRQPAVEEIGSGDPTTGDATTWQDCDARYDEEAKAWRFRKAWPASLDIDCGEFRMPVQPTPYGHIGLFPEQSENWEWLRTQGTALTQTRAQTSAANDLEPLWGLNLFGYTGASTMALASVGLAVAHVDAAKPNVQACRRAAEHNGWGDAKIRFLVDDAAKFLAREVRRSRRYSVVVMDPPAYGHSPRGKSWRLERDLWPLLDQCMEVLCDDFALLVTGHSPQVDQGNVADFLRRHQKLQAGWRAAGLNLVTGRSQLKDSHGRSLDAGFYVRLWSQPRPRV